MARDLLLIANAHAGSAEQERLQAALDVLRQGADVQVMRTADDADLDEALEAGTGGTIVVAGGDGSIHLAVERLWVHNREAVARTVFGLIPLGTGNDLARGVGLPLDPTEAAAVVRDGRARPLDLLSTDIGGVVLNAAHAGLGAVAAAQAAELKDNLGPLAYPVGALLTGIRESGYRLTVEVDGRRVHDGPALMVGVVNAPSIGGGTRLVPPAVPDDGLLDAVVVSAVTPAARLAFGAALRSEAHLDRDDVLHLRGRRVRIAGEPVAHDLDGELTPEVAERTYTVEPGAWRLLLP